MILTIFLEKMIYLEMIFRFRQIIRVRSKYPYAFTPLSKDKSSSKGKKVFSGLLSSFVLIALAGLLIFAGIRHFSNRTPSSSNIPQLIAVSSSVEEITKDDEKAYKIVFNTVNGKEVSFWGILKM